MKTQLPQNKKACTEQSRSGFTLIELLVVIAIIAVLATIGMALFSNTQSKARDAKRRTDVAEVTKAMDVSKGVDAAIFPGVYNTQFTPGVVPTDPVSGKNYCVSWALNTAGTLLADPAVWTTGSCATGTATAASSAWTALANNNPTGGLAYKVRVCASLEDTSASPQVVCSTTQSN